MNIFQKIINKEIPANILYEDQDVIAFYDINPRSPGHFLVVPKKHSNNLIDIASVTLIKLIIKARELALQEIKRLHVSGFKLEINNGVKAGQEILHTHIHIVPSQE